MTTTITDSQLGLDQSSVNKFLASFIDKMKLSSGSNMTYEETMDLMIGSYDGTGADSSVVDVIRAMKTDLSNKKLWDDMQNLVTAGNEDILAAPTVTNERKSVSDILSATNVPEFTSLDDWSNYISGSGTTLGGWMSGGPEGILNTTDSAITAALERRFNPVNNYRRIKSYASAQTLLKTDIPTSSRSMEAKLRGIEQFNAKSAEAFSARSQGAKKASRALGNVSGAVTKLGIGLSLGQGAIDLVSGINQNDGTRIAGGAIAMTGAMVSIGDSVAKKVSSSYKAASAVRAAGLGADLSSGAGKAAHFAPLVGGLIAIAAGIVSVVKNSQAADESFATGNWGRGAMFTTMAVLDSIAIVVDIVGTIADFIPGIGTAISFVCDIASTIIGLISDLIGVFTEIVDTRSDDTKVQDAFDAYLESSAFTDYIDKLAEEYKNQGFDILVYMTDAEAAEVDASGVDLEVHNTKIEKVRRELTTKVAKTSDNMRRQVKLDATGQSNIISGGDADDLLQVVRDRKYLGEATKLLRGLGGNDRIIGGNGPDTIIGGTGNDILYSREGSDYLFGGSGDDYLVPGADAVSAIGGLGHDVVVLNAPYTYYSGGYIGSNTLIVPGSMVSETWPGSSDPIYGRINIYYQYHFSMNIDINTLWPGPFSSYPYTKRFNNINGFEKVYIETKGRFALIKLSQYRADVGNVGEKTFTSINFEATGDSHGNTGNLTNVRAVLEEGSHTLLFSNVSNGIQGSLFGYAENSTHMLVMSSDTSNVNYVFIDRDDATNFRSYLGNQNVSLFLLGKVDNISLINSPYAIFASNAVREFDLTRLSETSPNVIISLSKGTVKLQENSFCNALLSLDSFRYLQAISSPIDLVFGPDKSNLLDLSHTTISRLDVNTSSNDIKLYGTSKVCVTFNNVTNFSFGKGRHTLRSPSKFVNVTLNGGEHDVSAAEFSKITSYAGKHNVSLERKSVLTIAAVGDTIGKTVTLDLEIFKPVTTDALQLEDYVVKINGNYVTEHHNLPAADSSGGSYDNLWFEINKEGYDLVMNMMMHHESDPYSLQQAQEGMLIKNNQDVQRYKDRANPFFMRHKRAINFSFDELETLTNSVTADYTNIYGNVKRYNFKVMYYKNTCNTVVLSGNNTDDASSTLKFFGVNDLSDFTAVYDSTAQALNVYCRFPEADSQKLVASYYNHDPVISYPIANSNLRSGIEALCSHFSTVVIDQQGTGENARTYDIEAFKSALFYLSEVRDVDLGLSSSLLPTFSIEFSPNNTMSYFIDGVGSTKIFDSRISNVNSGNASGGREYIDLLPKELSGITCNLDFSTLGKCIAWIDASKDNQWNIYSPAGSATRVTILMLSGVRPEQVAVTTSSGAMHVFNVNNTAKVHWYGIKPDIVYFTDTKKLYTGMNVDNQYTSPHSQVGISQNAQPLTVFPGNLIVDAHWKFSDGTRFYDDLKYPQAGHMILIERHPSFSLTYKASTPSSIVAGTQTTIYVGLPTLVSGQTYVLSVKGTLVPDALTPFIILDVRVPPGTYYEYSLSRKRTESVLNSSTIIEIEFTADNNNAMLEINNVKQTLDITGITVTLKPRQIVNAFPENIVLDSHLKSDPGYKWPQASHMVLVDRHPSLSVTYNASAPAPIVAEPQTNIYLGLPALVSGQSYLVTVNGTLLIYGAGIDPIKTIFEVRGNDGYNGTRLVGKEINTVLNSYTITEFAFTADNNNAVLNINNVYRTLNLSSVTVSTN